MKLYTVEVLQAKHTTYNFVSLYNGMRGTNYYNKEDAFTEGEKHQTILCAMYPELKKLVKKK